MTLMENNSNDSFGDSSFAIATAYRGSSDEDTRLVLNAMAHPAQIGNLTFYLVPCPWMETCLPFLTGQTDQRPTVKIENASLLLSTGEVSDEEAEETKFYGSRGRQESRELRRDIQHKSDFYCVGSHVWNLVSEKFGFDVELGYKVLMQDLNELNIDLGTQKVPIPAGGRFEYHPIPKKHTDVVSDEDDDLFPGPSGLTTRPAPQPQDDTVGASSSTAIILLPSSQSTGAESKVSNMSIEQVEPAAPVRNSTLKRKRYGSGLGNLGNTCFMNSTLQCLAHTEPLRRYFCSGDYQSDLNKDNPLGTGGELATEFAELLCEMWGSRETGTTTYNGVVYPRNFKYTLGRHAEQFLGYDQHDSQELATYLLDALHEDTNRVTKKPYIEKPEQGEDELDDVAARKAWDLHLEREDSRVLEHFMGQVKSRVQCPSEGCGRVSTTFDPFMYLSVPIPGATDRTMKVTFVPIEGPKREMKITMPKSGTILTMQKKVVEEWIKMGGKLIGVENLAAVDVWNGEVYNVYKHSEEVEKIRDTDVTFLYELKPSSELETLSDDDDDVDEEPINLPKRSNPDRIKLPVDMLSKLNQGEAWKRVFDEYVTQPTLLSTLFNPNRATKEALVRFYNKLHDFLGECYKELQLAKSTFDEQDGSDDDDNDEGTKPPKESLEALQAKGLQEVSQFHALFKNVTKATSVSRLEFAQNKLRVYILQYIEDGKNKYKDGISIQVVLMRKDSNGMMHRNSVEKGFTAPLCLRVPGHMKVYELREYLAECLPFKDEGPPARETKNLKTDVEAAGPIEGNDSDVVPIDSEGGPGLTNGNHSGDPSLFVMRQIPMGYSELRNSAYSYRPTYSPPSQLGMLERLDESSYDGRSVRIADCNDEEEKKRLSELFGQNGQISLYWPADLCDRYFDLDRYEQTEQITSSSAMALKENSKVISVSNCIEKYCQMEQLEETEMWYCNKCKEHVRAWKQFHLYRTPPILIVHLKRFHYSASTHRRDKIDAFIDFPLTDLDLTSEVMHWSGSEKPIYDCYAVSNHYGGLGGGHYTAYALSDDGKWGHYDDSRVSTDIDPKEVVSNAAYVLYYKRRDVVFETPEFEPPLPAIVQDHMDRTPSDSSNLVRVDSMDLDDDRAVAGSPPSSNTSTSPMAGMSPQEDDEFEYETDHLPPRNI